MDLFNQSIPERVFEKIPLMDGEIWIMRNFMAPEKAEFYFQNLLQAIEWKQEEIKVYGKTHAVPRKTAWYGYQAVNYTYSGIVRQPQPWTKELLENNGMSSIVVTIILSP